MIHIGLEIQKKIKEKQRTVSWLARELSCSRTNVYKILQRPYIDTVTLMHISKALEYDFFAIYSKELEA